MEDIAFFTKAQSKSPNSVRLKILEKTVTNARIKPHFSTSRLSSECSSISFVPNKAGREPCFATCWLVPRVAGLVSRNNNGSYVDGSIYLWGQLDRIMGGLCRCTKDILTEQQLWQSVSNSFARLARYLGLGKMNGLIRESQRRNLVNFGLTKHIRSVQYSLKYVKEIIKTHYASFGFRREKVVRKLKDVAECAIVTFQNTYQGEHLFVRKMKHFLRTGRCASHLYSISH